MLQQSMDSNDTNHIDDCNIVDEPLTAFNLFFRTKKAEILATQPDTTFSEINDQVTQAWDALEDKNQYFAAAEKDKQRYQQQRADMAVEDAPESPIPLSDDDEPLIIEQIVNAVDEAQDDEELVWGDDVCDSGSGARTTNGTMSNDGAANDTDNSVVTLANGTLCSRFGCSKQAQNCPEWDNEFCSSDCVVKQCRFVFDSFFNNQ